MFCHHFSDSLAIPCASRSAARVREYIRVIERELHSFILSSHFQTGIETSNHVKLRSGGIFGAKNTNPPKMPTAKCASFASLHSPTTKLRLVSTTSNMLKPAQQSWQDFSSTPAPIALPLSHMTSQGRRREESSLPSSLLLCQDCIPR